jgi:hypothetical protein
LPTTLFGKESGSKSRTELNGMSEKGAIRPTRQVRCLLPEE